MPTPSLAITGATRSLGGRTAQSLAKLGVAQRLIVRDPARAPSLPDAEVHVATYSDRAALARGLEGIRTLFFVSASGSPQRLAQHSRSSTPPPLRRPSGRLHLLLARARSRPSPSPGTTGPRSNAFARPGCVHCLRDNVYLDFLPSLVGDDGVIRGPAGQGRVAAVAQDDVADAAVAVLQDPPRTRRHRELSGAAALTLDESPPRWARTSAARSGTRRRRSRRPTGRARSTARTGGRSRRG